MKQLFILLMIIVLSGCSTKTDKTLYGSWQCISEQYDKGEAEEPYNLYYLDISGSCEEIVVEYRKIGGDLISSFTGTPVKNPKCFGKRDELTFVLGEEIVIWPLRYYLKMDKSRDTLKGYFCYEDPQNQPDYDTFDTCWVIFARAY